MLRPRMPPVFINFRSFSGFQQILKSSLILDERETCPALAFVPHQKDLLHLSAMILTEEMRYAVRIISGNKLRGMSRSVALTDQPYNHARGLLL